jgi:hypothetical protein
MISSFIMVERKSLGITARDEGRLDDLKKSISNRYFMKSIKQHLMKNYLKVYPRKLTLKPPTQLVRK